MASSTGTSESLSLPLMYSCAGTASTSKSKPRTDTHSSTAQWTGTNSALPRSSNGSANISSLSSNSCLPCPLFSVYSNSTAVGRTCSIPGGPFQNTAESVSTPAQNAHNKELFHE